MKCHDRQLTLHDLISALKQAKDSAAKVVFDFCGFAPDGTIDSYRGFYEDLALGWCEGGWSDSHPTVASLLAVLQGAIGKVFTGYKGGDYTASADTAMWVANPGKGHSTAIVGTQDHGYLFVIETQHAEF